MNQQAVRDLSTFIIAKKKNSQSRNQELDPLKIMRFTRR
jgi:hypothetical protein